MIAIAGIDEMCVIAIDGIYEMYVIAGIDEMLNQVSGIDGIRTSSVSLVHFEPNCLNFEVHVL